MSLKFSQGIYKLKCPDKYVGNSVPKYRSSWEFAVMKTLDENPAIINWASESIKVPYRDPLTGKNTIYVPDFFVCFIDRNHKKKMEVWEIKPQNQTLIEKVGKNPYNQAQFIRNQVKWKMAEAWCKQNKMTFRIITEKELFANGRVK